MAPANAATGLFTPFNASEGLVVKGGRSGTFDGMWALGSPGEDGDHLATANLDWVPGKLYNWSLAYDGAGNGSYSVKDGNTLLFTKSYQKDDNHRLRTGNAVAFTATAAAGLADAKLETAITSLNNFPLGATVATPGNNLAASTATAYFYPGLTAGMNVTGTIKLSFMGAVPTGSKLSFLVNAGTMSCYAP